MQYLFMLLFAATAADSSGLIRITVCVITSCTFICIPPGTNYRQLNIEIYIILWYDVFTM